ncbi:MAG: L,D-transpeptidase, partial [Chloroflexota bacterium]|nr:L,D-transpeptidase [Chloroflexota bacterium]
MSRGPEKCRSVAAPVASPFSTLRTSLFAIALVALVSSLIAPFSAAQEDDFTPPTKVWVEETGHTVDKTFLRDWRSYQMLIGDPITQEVRKRVKLDGLKTKERTLQYFENLVLVSTGDDKRPGDAWHVQAMPLGLQAFEADQKKLAKEDLPKASDCDDFSEEDCLYFKDTGHTVKLGFKGYWEVNKGKQLLGSPLTEEFVARDGWTTQYFMNGVLRWKDGEGIVPRALGAEAAKRDEVRTRAISQPDGVPVYSEAIFSPPVEVVEVTTPTGPGPQQGTYKEIVVSISQQYMWVYEDGLTILESYVSTGTAETIEVTTPIGYWSILTKYDSQT